MRRRRNTSRTFRVARMATKPVTRAPILEFGPFVPVKPRHFIDRHLRFLGQELDRSLLMGFLAGLRVHREIHAYGLRSREAYSTSPWGCGAPAHIASSRQSIFPPYVRKRTEHSEGASNNCYWNHGGKELTMVSYGIVDLPWWGYLAITLVLTHITIAAVTIFLHRPGASGARSPSGGQPFLPLLAMAHHRHGHEELGCDPPQAPRALRDRGRPAQPADRRDQQGAV